MKKRVELRVDGASRGNPGHAACGVFIKRGDETVKLAKYLGEMTNNEAEYHGLIEALNWIVENDIQEATIYADSLLIVNQMKGKYRVKARNLQPLFLKAVELADRIPRLTITHVKREKNREADALANAALERNLGEKNHA